MIAPSRVESDFTLLARDLRTRLISRGKSMGVTLAIPGDFPPERMWNSIVSGWVAMRLNALGSLGLNVFEPSDREEVFVAFIRDLETVLRAEMGKRADEGKRREGGL